MLHVFVFVPHAQPCQQLACVAPYQTGSGGTDIRLFHPPRPGSSLSEQIETGHFTIEPIGQLSPIGGLRDLQGLLILVRIKWSTTGHVDVQRNISNSISSIESSQGRAGTIIYSLLKKNAFCFSALDPEIHYTLSTNLSLPAGSKQQVIPLLHSSPERVQVVRSC